LVDSKYILGKVFLGRHRATEYEIEAWRAMASVRGKLFVDIGAGTGLYCSRLRKHFARVLAIEPNPMLASRLRRHKKLYLWRNVSIMEAAVGELDGTATLYLDTGGGSGDTLMREFDYKPGKGWGGSPGTFKGVNGIEVALKRFDSIVSEPVELVKVDVEGAEFKVLDGMKCSLERHLVKNIVVEVHDISKEDEMRDLLQHNGFSVERLDGHPRLMGRLPT
jgi:FkbM family methyltransferase